MARPARSPEPPAPASGPPVPASRSPAGPASRSPAAGGIPELTPGQVAARLGTTARTVQRWIAAGRLPARRVGGRWRVPADGLDALDAFGPTAAPRPAQPAGTRSGRPSAGPALRTLFIANRGEIARRIARSAAALGIRPVPAGEVEPELDLLDAAAIVAAARAAGADALHPGYGFLAESAAFAVAVEAAGLAWVGPPAPAIAAMGDKAGARRLAARLGLPVLPGYDGDAQDDRTLLAAAARMGPPLLVKPSAGGGGKGMRTLHDLAGLPEALAAARREARAAFGDDRLVLERLLLGPRHVEVQVLFDAQGHGVHLGERDCSAQRRHQKILEESPSPAVTPDLRRRLGEAALALAAAVGYRSAGTVEFLLDAGGDFWFLEMNTRLQVEHPVTELVTGRDLVADQLWIAGGASLHELGLAPAAEGPAGGWPAGGWPAGGRGPFGHAVEVRLYAEDAAAGFLPATGRVELLRWPAGAAAFALPDGAGIRVDAGIRRGDEVGRRFDPLLAKIVAGGRDRAEALDRLAAALDETVVLGLTTNLRFLRWLVRQPWLAAGEARVDTVERAWPGQAAEASRAVEASGAALPDDVWAIAAARLETALETGELPVDGSGPGSTLRAAPGTVGSRARRAAATADPWAGGWRPAGPALVLEAEGCRRRVAVPAARPLPDGATALADDGTVHVDVDGRSVGIRLAAAPDVEAARRGAAHQAGNVDAQVVAPMPGAVLAVHVVPGALLDQGDPVVTLEAMKMEHVVSAPGPGRVGEVLVGPADQVVRGQLLAVLVGPLEDGGRP